MGLETKGPAAAAFQSEPSGASGPHSFAVAGLVEGVYLNLPNPTFLSVRIINPNMEFIGTREKSRFWWVKVDVQLGFEASGPTHQKFRRF